jgi:hypothetical protein
MNQKSVKDYYSILGVPPTASLEEIRLAYRRQARVFHPDLNTDPEAEIRFKEINEAYDVLANAEKRRAYDYFVSNGEPPPPSVEIDAETAAGDDPPPAAGAKRSADLPTGASQPTSPRQKGAPAEQQASNVAPTNKGAASRAQNQRIYPPTWAILLIILGLGIMVTVGVGALLSLRQNRPTGGAESVSVTKLTTFLSPPEIPADQTVLQEDDTPLETLSPTQLSVADRTFPIVAVLPEQGRWPLPAEQTDLGMWMHGTLINYVVGLPHTSETESLLSGLMSEDRIVLTLENGSRLTFASPQTRRVSVEDRSPLAQDRPGLTLMLLGSGQPSRLVVTARYLPEDVLPSSDQRADGLAVRVLRADVLSEATPEVADAWYFVVEYAITNTLTTPVDATYFDMVLEDAAGQRYVLNEEATRRGEHGRLTVELPGGASAAGSAGYLLPRTVTMPLVWIFRADPASAEQAQLILDFEAPRPSPALPDVELYDAFLDGGRDVVVISGTVYNDGEMSLTVDEDAVELTSSEGEGKLAASTPLLPWDVPSDGYQDFELQFSVPEDAASVLLNVLGFTFAIEGLAP